jgi:hypothetical protein
MKKKGKKFINDEYDQFAVSYGTVDYTNNKSVYIDITSWVEPLDADNPRAMISSMNKLIRKTIFEELPKTSFNPKIYISDLDLRESGISVGKRSFMSCNVTLYNRGEVPYEVSDVTHITDTVIEALKTKFGDILIFNKKKKE